MKSIDLSAVESCPTELAGPWRIFLTGRQFVILGLTLFLASCAHMKSHSDGKSMHSMTAAGTVTLAKGCQSYFVAPPNYSGTKVTINSAVTATAASGGQVYGGLFHPYMLTLTLSNAANPAGFSGSNTYFLNSATGTQSKGVAVDVTVGAGKYGTFNVTGSTTVDFSGGSVTGKGDTLVSVVEPKSAASKLKITKESVKVAKHHDSVNLDIKIKNKGNSDANLTVTMVAMPQGGKRAPARAARVGKSFRSHAQFGRFMTQTRKSVAPGEEEIFSFSDTADGSVGSSVEYAYHITGTLDRESIDIWVGTGCAVSE